ncbi:MAG TPA: RuBisCO large subunit C-terminal-like domain-containing protein [Longilinea sp.]|nr:RuBisCO large subunit C-terminal-like domain-containing protein [Longilinea sp.]
MSSIPDEVVVVEEGLDSNDYVVATYLFQGEAGEDMLSRTVSMAVEQTVGRGIFSMPEFHHLLGERGAKVLSIVPVPDHESRVSEDEDRALGKAQEWLRYIVRVAFPVENTAYQIPMLINATLSDSSLGGMIKLVDLVMPAKFIDKFQGPKFGMEGIRKMSNSLESRRPLICTILKPSNGMTAKEASDIFYQHALGGTDFVKDDELMAYYGDIKVEDRVKAVMESEKRAFEQTGQRVSYFPNITDYPKRIKDNAMRAIEAGAPGVMVTPLTIGIGTLQMLAEDPDITVPIFAHPGCLGSHSWSPDFGISEHIYIGKLFRLAGADMVAIPVPYGKFTHKREKFIKLFKMNGSPMRHIKPIFTQTGGGVDPINAYPALQDIGNDVMLVAGGSIQAHPMGIPAGIRALRQTIQAYMDNMPLEEAAKQHPELKAAWEKWGPKK